MNILQGTERDEHLRPSAHRKITFIYKSKSREGGGVGERPVQTENLFEHLEHDDVFKYYTIEREYMLNKI